MGEDRVEASDPVRSARPDAAPVPTAGPDATFEQIMSELEAVTDRLASGELGIEAAADLYERAERLHAQASERLAQVQTRVDRLAGGTDPPA